MKIKYTHFTGLIPKVGMLERDKEYGESVINKDVMKALIKQGYAEEIKAKKGVK